jgi:redox-sensitive bicupin YhaK (pirin superfamily)
MVEKLAIARDNIGEKLTQSISAQPTQDGDGVKIHRLAGRHLHQALNPFLMIDEINSDDAADYIGGFPEHPHRGVKPLPT